MVARNATDVFNRGLPSWRTMLWDARVEQLPNGQIKTPAGAETPSGLSGVLAAQAILAMADNREMHADQSMDPFAGGGAPGSNGGPMPPLGDSGGEETLTDIWANITNRVVINGGYQTLLAAAYPNTSLDQITIANLANALAAFQTEKLTTLDTPFDRYLRGDDAALTSEQKQGAILFYGKANCSSCHMGELMTDQKPHNILVPELGPGKDTTPGEDRGRMDVTGLAADNYGFRTPPLRNVAQTGPYMHNGAIGTLEAVVRHHLDPKTGFLGLDTSHLPVDLASTVKNTVGDLHEQEPTVDAEVSEPLTLTEAEVDDLVKFLDALTDVSLVDKLKDLEPVEVPSNIDTGYGEGGMGGGGGPATGGGEEEPPSHPPA
jgi:cytochrome c peroxidase